MDAQVLQAMAKWPKVPACYGWLGLDARGDWYMRNDATQRQGAFPQAKGARLQHATLIAFIHRNYAADARGQWYFQNGPQRVYVSLEAAPYVLRCDGQGGWHTHTGISLGHTAQDWRCFLDENGRLFVQNTAGFGIVHSAHMLDAAQALQDSVWPEPDTLPFADMPQVFSYVCHPVPSQEPHDAQ